MYVAVWMDVNPVHFTESWHVSDIAKSTDKPRSQKVGLKSVTLVKQVQRHAKCRTGFTKD